MNSHIVITVSDIHGNIDTFTELDRLILKYPNAHIVFLGDYVDGHKYGYQVLNRIYAYQESWHDQVTVLLGNHEQIMFKYLDNPLDFTWFGNGGKITLKEWNREIAGTAWSANKNRKYVKAHDTVLLNWLRHQPLTYTQGNLFFVHAGLDWSKSDPKHQTRRDDMLWLRDEYIFNPDTLNRNSTPTFAHNTLHETIVTGHTPTVLISGQYDSASQNPPLQNHFADRNLPCPIKKIQYENEAPRYFIDGGNHSGDDNKLGNVAVFDDRTGLLIDSYQD